MYDELSPVFQPSGIITLTTDFGHRDPFVGVMKGRMLQRHDAARIVDLTHEVSPHWPDEAGFWLGRSFRYFPRGTVHVAVVDPGVGTARDVAIVETEGHVFLAPDNGLLTGVLGQATSTVTLRRLDATVLPSLEIVRLSATFHGRDLFAPIAAELAAGRLAPARLGPVVENLVPGRLAPPAVTDHEVSGVVVTTDHFGNLLTNIDARMLENLRSPRILVGGLDLSLQRTYGDVGPGGYVALINAFGVLEVARAGLSAAAGLDLGHGAKVTVRGQAST
jgi:S-adenosylmethionine hydrolase